MLMKGMSVMAERSVILLLVLTVFWVGCGDPVIDSAKDLKNTEAKEIIWKKDGAKMALIPAGSFEMGDHFDEGQNDEHPVHTVELDAFYMDIHEVTVSQFRKFVEDSGYVYNKWDSVDIFLPADEHPIININWNDAIAYCEWAGKRLPTEVEWEYAVRGGLSDKRYPWGDGEGVARDYANYSGIGGKDQWKKSTAPVGSLKPNGYGLFDMSGNAWEWCSDQYSRNYYTNSLMKNPTEPKAGQFQVLRGGSWNSTLYTLRVANRFFFNPNLSYFFSGFRCVSGF